MNIAVIGLGYWGQSLVRNFLSIECVDRVIGYDIEPHRLMAARKTFPAIEAASSFDEVLQRDDITGVVIATPNPTHYPLGMRVLAAGKHLLLEQPMASKTSEAEALLEAAYSSMLTLMVDHAFVYTSAVQKIKELLVRDDIGEVLYLDSVRASFGLRQPSVDAISELASHDISIIDYLIDDKPVAVSCTGMNYFGEQVDLAYITLHFREQLLVQAHASCLAPVTMRKIIIGGAKLMIIYDDMELSDKIKVYDHGVGIVEGGANGKRIMGYRTGNMYSPNLDPGESLGRVTREFVECMSTGKPSIADGQAGVNVVRVLQAAAKSMRLFGQRVDV